MDSMAALGEFFSQLGTNDSTAAIGRINGDADVHDQRAELRPLNLKCALKVTSTKHKVQMKKRKAGDPRYRLPLSQLVSPCEGGPSEGGSISASPNFAKGLASHIFMFFSSNLQLRQLVNRLPSAACDSIEK